MSGIGETAKEFAHRFGWILLMLFGVPIAMVGALAVIFAPMVAVVAFDYLGMVHVAEDDWIVFAGMTVAQLVWMAAAMALLETVVPPEKVRRIP